MHTANSRIRIELSPTAHAVCARPHMAMALHKRRAPNQQSDTLATQSGRGAFAPRGFGLGRWKDRERITMALSARTAQPELDEPALRTLDEADHSSCDLVRDLGHPTAYNEEAFRYFLANERRRSEVSNRPFLLLLVDLQQHPLNARIESSLAAKLFAGITACLRETDVIGWYHEGRVAGAVLTHVEETSSSDAAHAVRDRLTGVLVASLPATFASRLQVRVYQIPAGLQQ
jgi:hypothetical protein